MRKLILGALFASLSTPALAVTEYGFVQVYNVEHTALMGAVSFTFDSNPIPPDAANPFGGVYGNVIWGFFDAPGYTFNNDEIGVIADWITVPAPIAAGSITFPLFTLYGKVNGVQPLLDGTNDFLGSVTSIGSGPYAGLGPYAFDFCTTSVSASSSCGESIPNWQYGDAPISGAPEPAAWVVMMMGFGMVGGAMRYRTRSVRAQIA